MNKNIRLVVVLCLLVAVAIIAGSKTVWSKPGKNAPLAQTDSVSAVSPSIAVSNVGTVDTPNCSSGVEITGSGSGSVCGAVTLTGLGDANVKAVQSVREGDFISKTVNLYFTSGTAKLCFAAPNGGSVYFKTESGTTWTTLATTITDGVACVVVSESGSYAFGK